MKSSIMNKDNLRLNNFILWCKNWYEPINKNMNVFDQAKAALYLDGYHSPQEVELKLMEKWTN